MYPHAEGRRKHPARLSITHKFPFCLDRLESSVILSLTPNHGGVVDGQGWRGQLRWLAATRNFSIGSLDDFDCPAPMAAHGILQFVPRIAAVSEDMTQPRTADADRVEQVRSAITILNVCPVDQHEDQEAECIGDDMALAAFDLFACIIPRNPATFGGFDALAVDDASGRLGLLALDLARSHHQKRKRLARLMHRCSL
jgi:hypothetical protein